MFENETINSVENEGAFVDQTNEELSEIDSFDQTESSEDGSVSMGACVAAGGVGASLALLATWGIKKISEMPKVQEHRASRKEHRELRKEKRAALKKIRIEAKEKIEDVLRPKTEESAPEVLEEENKNENKKSSKK